MGQFVVAFSFLVVILQATTMLLERSASTWSFFLLQAVPNLLAPNMSLTLSQQECFSSSTIIITSVQNDNASSNASTNNNNRSTVVINNNATQNALCLLQTHAPHQISTVLKEWNPHAILLTLCGIQLLICIAKTQHSREIKPSQGTDDAPLIHFPFYYGVGLLTILLLVILIITGLKHADLVQYPTIIAIIVLLLCIIWYAKTFDGRAEDMAWNLAFHMQVVSVPLAVLSISTLGARLWIDVLTHAVLLSAAANCLWLQSSDAHPWSLQIIRIVTLLLPTLSLILAHLQWGYADNWLYAVALMGCAGLLPLYVFTVIVPEADERRNEKVKLRMAHLCTGGALLSVVVNLGMLSHDLA